MDASRSSIVNSWDSRSAVRSKSRRILDRDTAKRTFFPLALAPCATHPLVTAKGQEAIDEFLIRRLYLYLDAISVIELEIVNPVLVGLTTGRLGLELPDDMRLDAYRIYCDEAYHAVSVVDLRLQVEALTQVRSRPVRRLPFAQSLRLARSEFPAAMVGYVDLCAAIVSETLISGALSEIPRDVNVNDTVRASVADHAADERVHHAYFARVLEIMWQQVGERGRAELTRLLGNLVLAFLDPNLAAQASILVQMGFGVEAAQQICAESIGRVRYSTEMHRAARGTLSAMRRVGALDDKRVQDSLCELGLLL